MGATAFGGRKAATTQARLRTNGLSQHGGLLTERPSNPTEGSVIPFLHQAIGFFLLLIDFPC